MGAGLCPYHTDICKISRLNGALSFLVSDISIVNLSSLFINGVWLRRKYYYTLPHHSCKKCATCTCVIFLKRGRGSLRTADMFSVITSPPPKKECLRNRAAKRFPWRKTFCFDVGQSLQRIEYNSSDSSWPRALACLGFWQELPNLLWNVNFTTFNKVSCDVECWLLCEAAAS